MSEPVFALSAEDLRSNLWKRLEAHLKVRLDALRISNDGDLTVEKTAKLRGRIAEVKTLLLLSAPAPKIDPELQDPD